MGFLNILSSVDRQMYFFCNNHKFGLKFSVCNEMFAYNGYFKSRA